MVSTNLFKLMDALFDGAFSTYQQSETFLTYPPTNIYTTKERNNIVVEMGVAGFSEKELKVYYEGGQLIVEGVKEKKHYEREYIVRNLSKRQFKFSLPLPNNKYDVDNIEVVFENGMLEITIPLITEKKTFPLKTFSLESKKK